MLRLGLLFTHGISLDDWNEGGFLLREVEYYQNLYRNNIKTTFYTYGNKKDFSFNKRIKHIHTAIPYKVKVTKNSKFTLINNIISILYIVIKSRKEDLLKTNQLKAALPAILVKVFFFKPYLLRIGYEPLMNRLVDEKRDYLKILFVYIFSFIAYKFSCKILVPSSSIKSFLIENYKLNPKKIVRIPNFVDTKKFRQLENVQRENRILFVGRLEDEKNPILLLEALLRLHLPATFVGSGPLKQKIIERMKINQVNPDIKLINYVANEHLPEFYSAHSILVMPSKYEGQPKVLLEAMACQCAVIGTDVSGIRSIIKNNNNGLLAGNNLNSLANTINSLWNDSNKRESIGINARDYVLSSHSIKKVAEKETQVIKEFLKKIK